MSVEDLPVWLCIERSSGLGRPDFAVSNMPGDDKHCFWTGKRKHLADCGWYRLTNTSESPPDPRRPERRDGTRPRNENYAQAQDQEKQ